GKQGALPAPPITPQSLEVPPEVDLCLADLVAVEGEDLRVPEAASVGPGALVGHDDLVALLDQPLELEPLDQLGVRPAALEVTRPIDSVIRRVVDGDIVGPEPFDDAAIVG